MDSKIHRSSSVKSFITTPPESDFEESEHEPVCVTDSQCIKYCLTLVPDRLDIETDSIETCTEDINYSKYSYLVVERILGGITNTLYKVTNTKNNKSVLIRFFGPSFYKIINRLRHRCISDLLSKFRISKTIYCYFKDGLIEEWIEGRNITDDELRQGNYMTRIAQNLKKLHSISVRGEKARVFNGGEDEPKSSLWPTIWKYYSLCRKYVKKYNKQVPNVDFHSLKQKMLILEKICNKVNSPLVLCHCDLLSGNIILLPNDHVRFIDFEYSCCMERAFDIANHFNEYMGFAVDLNSIPSIEVQREFIREYLKYNTREKSPNLEGLIGDIQVSDSEESVNELLLEIQPFFMASNLFWGIWSVLQSIFSTVEFGYFEYAQKKLDMFINDKFWDKYDELT